ncbi:1964_t:CDS:2, partial [Gigaspora rosea]
MQPQYEMDLQGEMDLQYEVDSQPENESEDEMESQDKINEIEMQDEIESEDQMEAQDEVEMQSAIEDIEKDYIVRENDNSNNYSDNDSITGKDVIVDAPMSMNTNESASYFENLTFAKMFCWIQKHNISTSAYNDLVEILQNPAFKADNV